MAWALLDLRYVVTAAETLGIDLVDIFGAGRPNRKPSVFGSHKPCKGAGAEAEEEPASGAGEEQKPLPVGREEVLVAIFGTRQAPCFALLLSWYYPKTGVVARELAAIFDGLSRIAQMVNSGWGAGRKRGEHRFPQCSRRCSRVKNLHELATKT